MHKLNFIIPLFLFSILFTGNVYSQEEEENEKERTEEVEKDEDEKDEKKKEKFKPYDKVITKDAISDEGVFTVHKVDEKYYFEIPNNYLDKDMLLVTRVAKLPTSSIAFHAGKKTSEMLVNWQRYHDKILIKVKDYEAVADENDPIKTSVDANFYNPTLYAFDIKTFNTDSTTTVIDVTPFYSGEVNGMSGIPSYLKKEFKVGGLDKSRSFIDAVKSFPENIEVIQNFTYKASEPPAYGGIETLSIQVNQSMILLPEDQMQPRLADNRVGWFTMSQVDYSSEKLKSDEKTYIRRWRLEPKDPIAYARGELVEPIKPIVYYIDPATPTKFIPYFREGIELWQKAFEAAGFKNAIIAKDAPSKEEDPDFSPEDVRYSVVRYIATDARNAMGPSVTDPRSGEIIESDILWYHNHLKSYRNRYLIETGAANPKARTLDTPLEEIGEMMKMVIAHEVGHTLGLPHNMAASYAYDVENYRDAAFTQKNGIAATIMDYARFNYIAQPGDEGVRFIRQLGPYDEYAINWGYRYYNQFKSPEAEVNTLNKVIEEKAGDPTYKFGGFSRFDPSAQTEDIGNNSMKASTYGVNNLKIVAENLLDWTSAGTNDYADLDELHNELVGAYSRYVRHVISHVGGVEETMKKPNQDGAIYKAISKSDQREAVIWLHNNLFDPPLWLMNEEVMNKIEHDGFVEEISRLQVGNLGNLLGSDRFERLIDYETKSKDNYTAIGLIEDVRNGIWSELGSRETVSIYRRNLQKGYVSTLISLMEDNKNSEIGAIARGELKNLADKLERADRSVKDKATKYHYQASYAMIVDALDIEK